MKFIVDVEEIYTKAIEVDAKTADEAVKKVEEAYREDEIQLSDEDFYDYRIRIFI